MSQEESISRKEKRAQRDAERHKKGNKRKRTEADENVAVDQEQVADAPEQQDESTTTGTKTSRKRKSDDDRAEVTAETNSTKDTPRPKKRKKSSTSEATGADDDTADKDAAQKPTKSRFIVFVGNLPFKTTDDSLRIHFKKLEPFNLRHRTDPKTKKSKGFAFLEFENYDRMKTCLKLYHHSMFDPADPTAGENPTQEDTGRRAKKSNARRINVELTAGGGGKTEGRQAKIKAKNERLEEQRKRRAEAERKEKERKEKKEGGKAKKPANKDGDSPTTGGVEESAGMHPSRLAMINR